MTATRQAKARVSEIGVPRQKNNMQKEKWLQRLDRLRQQNWIGRYGKTAQEIQDEDRAERF